MAADEVNCVGRGICCLVSCPTQHNASILRIRVRGESKGVGDRKILRVCASACHCL